MLPVLLEEQRVRVRVRVRVRARAYTLVPFSPMIPRSSIRRTANMPRRDVPMVEPPPMPSEPRSLLAPKLEFASQASAAAPQGTRPRMSTDHMCAYNMTTPIASRFADIHSKSMLYDDAVG